MDNFAATRKQSVKLRAGGIEAFLGRPSANFQAVLLYGPNRGLVWQGAEKLIRSVTAEDSSRVIVLSGEQLSGNPSLLFEMTETPSLFCKERRVIRITGADEALISLFISFFRHSNTQELVVVEAGELGPKSRLRSLFETTPQAAALPCYLEDERTKDKVIHDYLTRYGLRVDLEAKLYLGSCLPGDRLAAEGELDKLRSFMGSQTQVSLQHVQDCIGDGGMFSLGDPAWAAASGDKKAVIRSLEQLLASGAGFVAVLRAAQRHFLRLHEAAAQVEAQRPPGQVVEQLKPPIFFKQRDLFRHQLRIWSVTKLGEMLDKLRVAECECKRSGYPGEVICVQVLLEVASSAPKSPASSF